MFEIPLSDLMYVTIGGRSEVKQNNHNQGERSGNL